MGIVNIHILKNDDAARVEQTLAARRRAIDVHNQKVVANLPHDDCPLCHPKS